MITTITKGFKTIALTLVACTMFQTFVTPDNPAVIVEEPVVVQYIEEQNNIYNTTVECDNDEEIERLNELEEQEPEVIVETKKEYIYLSEDPTEDKRASLHQPVPRQRVQWIREIDGE